MSRRQNHDRGKSYGTGPEQLGDEYTFTRDPELAQQRSEARRRRRQAAVAKSRALMAGPRCIAPDCDLPAKPKLSEDIKFLICALHAEAIWRSVQWYRSDSDMRQAANALEARRELMEREALERKAVSEKAYRDAQRSPDAAGHIYFVRLNGLVKAGWSASLYQRIRSYGPSAEILAHHPGTRRDETELHRSLAPARAKGREWYHDSDVVRMFIAKAIEMHGPPTVQVHWTEHANQQAVKPRYWR